MRLRFSLLLSVILLFGASQIDAQRRGAKRKKKEPKVTFQDRLWYGGGFTLGLSGQNGASIFVLGLSPMVGYKFNKILSAGPRLDLTLITGRAQTFGGVDRFTYLEYGGALFARAKFLRFLFVHLEGGYKNYGIPVITSEVEIRRYQRNTLLAGLGYNSGGGTGSLGFEYLLLYDFLFPPESTQLPIEFRIGFNYNF